MTPHQPQRIVCFGELLLRLGAPGRERLLQTHHFDVHVGGAEANVAVSLAALGHDAVLVGAVSDNALGTAAIGELRRHGVDVSLLRRAPGRMGLYFLATGAGHRPSKVLYDRANSAFATSPATGYDWPVLLDGAAWLHVSGVTPALGQTTADAAHDAVRAARERGVRVAFDGNFRATLWSAWDGDATAILRGLMAHADIAFADHRDVAMVLGEPLPVVNETTPEQRIIDAAARAFAAFPSLQRLASTMRTQHSVDRHTLGAVMVSRDGALHRTPDYQLRSIVDRIGAGDAFAAGVLHGLATGMSDADALAFGLAAACLKHSVRGDFNLVDGDDIAALLREERLDVRR